MWGRDRRENGITRRAKETIVTWLHMYHRCHHHASHKSNSEVRQARTETGEFTFRLTIFNNSDCMCVGDMTNSVDIQGVSISGNKCCGSAMICLICLYFWMCHRIAVWRSVCERVIPSHRVVSLEAAGRAGHYSVGLRFLDCFVSWFLGRTYSQIKENIIILWRNTKFHKRSTRPRPLMISEKDCGIQYTVGIELNQTRQPPRREAPFNSSSSSTTCLDD